MQASLGATARAHRSLAIEVLFISEAVPASSLYSSLATRKYPSNDGQDNPRMTYTNGSTINGHHVNGEHANGGYTNGHNTNGYCIDGDHSNGHRPSTLNVDVDKIALLPSAPDAVPVLIDQIASKKSVSLEDSQERLRLRDAAISLANALETPREAIVRHCWTTVSSSCFRRP